MGIILKRGGGSYSKVDGGNTQKGRGNIRGGAVLQAHRPLLLLAARPFQKGHGLIPCGKGHRVTSHTHSLNHIHSLTLTHTLTVTVTVTVTVSVTVTHTHNHSLTLTHSLARSLSRSSSAADGGGFTNGMPGPVWRSTIVFMLLVRGSCCGGWWFGVVV